MSKAAKVLLVLTGAAVVLALLTFGATALLNGRDVPLGVTVAGTDIGGQSRAAARDDLERVLGARARGPIRLVADGESLALSPAVVGLSLDLGATLDAAEDAGPIARVRGMFRATRDITPRTTSDRARLTTAVTALAAQFDQPAREGSVRFDGSTPVAVSPQRGRSLDVEATVGIVLDQWLTRDSFDVPVVVTENAVSEQAVQDALSLATPAVSGELRLTSGTDTLVLTPLDTASALTFAVSPEGALTPQVNATSLIARLGDRIDVVQNEPSDATFDVTSGTPVLVPAKQGRTVSAPALSAAVLAAIEAPDRTAELALDQAAPRIGTAEAQTLGIKEKISTFTTKHPCCAPRVSNIHRIADLVDGTIVLPGETFSLNGAVGERTVAKGFVSAPQITEGEFVQGVGGGISQFTTTLYNASFFAGLQDVEHKPHSYYISRYPEGREATISYPTPDLKFKNDSSTGVLITTSYTGTSVTVTLYGTKRYDEVLSLSSGRSKLTSPQTQTKPAGPACKAQSGEPGFTVTITRVMKVGGKQVKQTKATHRYLAEPRIVCV